jgi:hypothetical protein
MYKSLMVSVSILIILIVTSFSCNSLDAASSNITGNNGPAIEAQYTLEEVLDIARDFSPECRKRIPPQEGSG